MPGFPDYDPLDIPNWLNGKQREAGVSVKFVAADGITYSARLSGLGAADLAIGEKTRLAEAMGAVSNMGVYELVEDKTTSVNIIDAEAYDEAYANPGDILVLHFENASAEKYTVDVPAPDARFFESDGVTLKPRTDATDGTVIGELIDASLNVINTSFLPVNTFAFVRGVRRQRKMRLPAGQRPRPAVSEPAAAPETNPGT